MVQSIEYGSLMHEAMRGLIRKVLDGVAANGLPGAHHFFITFDTDHPDVELADWLSDRYPGEMTVVMQHWYDKLEVGADGFSVTLNFGDSPEPLYIPYDAIKTFVDPSVEFGLRFETQNDEAAADQPAAPAPAPVPAPITETPRMPPVAKEPDEKPEGKPAEVVSLDSFRKT